MPIEVERCVRRILPSMKTSYPNKTPAERRSIAWGICTNLYKQGKLRRDGNEHEF